MPQHDCVRAMVPRALLRGAVVGVMKIGIKVTPFELNRVPARLEHAQRDAQLVCSAHLQLRSNSTKPPVLVLN